MSDLEAGIWQRFRDQGLVMYGVNTQTRGDTPAIAAKVVRDQGISFPVLLDDSEYVQQFEPADDGISAFPMQVLIDRTGTLRLVRRRYERETLAAAIEAALAE